MKDVPQSRLEANRPDWRALDCIEFCLKELFAEERKRTDDICAGQMTYEEVIGALVAAQHELRANEN